MFNQVNQNDIEKELKTFEEKYITKKTLLMSYSKDKPNDKEKITIQPCNLDMMSKESYMLSLKEKALKLITE